MPHRPSACQTVHTVKDAPTIFSVPPGNPHNARNPHLPACPVQVRCGRCSSFGAVAQNGRALRLRVGRRIGGATTSGATVEGATSEKKGPAVPQTAICVARGVSVVWRKSNVCWRSATRAERAERTWRGRLVTGAGRCSKLAFTKPSFSHVRDAHHMSRRSARQSTPLTR